ncbi:MAG: hypothetical protein ACYC8T_11760 [Myxococcaceae bacterium]
MLAVLGGLAGAFLVLVVLVSFGAPFIVQVPLLLAFGWVAFLASVASGISLNLEALGTAGLVLVATAWGGHRLAVWLSRQLRPGETPTSPPAWKARHTLATVGVVGLLFANGTAVLGSIHQVGWLFASEEPWVTSSWRFRLPSRLENNCARIWFGAKEKPVSASREDVDEALSGMATEEFHVLAITRPDGGVSAVVAFPRDPIVRQEHGLSVCTPEGFRNERAQDLASVIATLETAANGAIDR